MFVSILETIVASSFVAVVSAFALPQRPGVMGPPSFGFKTPNELKHPFHVADAGRMCHCEDYNEVGTKLEWAQSHAEGGPSHFNCHYGVGPDEETNCGYNPIGHLEEPFHGSDCPEKVAHLLCY